MENKEFQIEEFDIKLDTEEIGRQFVYIQHVDSTNTYLLNNKDLKIHGTVALAEEQTKGRGRMNRDWQSQPEQNLTFSILLRKVDGKKINIVNLGASLVVAQAIENLYQLNTSLKWPNDVLIDNKKTAGILLESVSKANELDRVVVGIGINVNQTNFAGKYLIEPTSVRKEFKSRVSREKLLSEVLNLFEETLYKIDEKPEEVLEDWKERCKMIGGKIKVESTKETKYGIFEDIDNEGFLLLKINDRVERIHFGDVSLR
ncbi:biotin-protein ligase [hydrocarbon metagenome]|uniref:Biotin-protein ligase n=1 Tax=hydrocarbon metagenome TaxID=938273 RepID=A0A0W8FZ06_9ZZZZ